MGLGNPGPQYVGTRHNVGFRAIELLASRQGVTSWRSKFEGKFSDVSSLGAALLMPMTFMNDSGQSVALAAAFFRLPVHEVLVVCDDINLPFGRLRFRRGGSDGGHNGLKDIISALHSEDFPRLRIGVDRPGVDTIGHVLGSFAKEEESQLPEILGRTVAGIETFLNSGAEAALTQVNAFNGDPDPAIGAQE